MITAAVIWGLLEKSKFFGEEAVIINAILSLSVSFFFWGFLIGGLGAEVGPTLSSFFGQMSLVIVGFVFMLLMGGLFFKDFPKYMQEHMTWAFWTIFIIGFLIAIGTGLFPLGRILYNFFHGLANVPGGDIGVFLIILLILIIMLILVSAAGGG